MLAYLGSSGHRRVYEVAGQAGESREHAEPGIKEEIRLLGELRLVRIDCLEDAPLVAMRMPAFVSSASIHLCCSLSEESAVS